MLSIAAQLRAMHLFYHQAHHLVKGPAFFGDHKAFLRFYKELEDNYDEVAERIVALSGPDYLDLRIILIKAEHTLGMFPSLNSLDQNGDFFHIGLTLEKELCAMCSHQIEGGSTEGTKQLLGDICNQSEIRQYKIHQRGIV